MYGSRILLIAPHPDDELAGCCAAVGRARAQGSTVAVAFLTTGIPSPERFWPWQRPGHAERVERRRAEAQRVAAKIGVEIAHVSKVAARRLKDEMGAARDVLLGLCAKRKADMVWAPAYEGGHPDHDAASFIASTLRGERPVWEFSEYNFCGGRVHSNEFAAPTVEEVELKLSAEEQRVKKMLLGMYASERGNLSYLRTEREVFRPQVDYDYSRPPHPGTLFYRRYAWAAFHPRVNEVRPEEVCRAIAEFRARA
jgi:LmbE family N-acetylglucosaminyl deacetylase